MKRILQFLGILLVVLIAVVLFRTLRFTSEQEQAAPAPELALDAATLAEHLAGGLQFPTVSYQDSARFDSTAFRSLHGYLREVYPLVHQRLQWERVNGFSLLYRWQGSDASQPPILLMAHMDVVPIDTATADQWEHPPFSGDIAEGYIWGRGAIDDKASLFGILDAVEYLLQQNFQPRRTIYLAFGHDEEVGGLRGASRIAGLLQQRGVQFDLVLDEGGAISRGMIPGVRSDVALIGIAEKGYVTVELLVEGEGGHSSMPPRETTVGILCRAIARLEAHQMPARLEGPVRQMFTTLGPEMGFGQKLLMANLWLFARPLAWLLTRSPSSNAMVRTTTAPTMLQGSVKENVLASRARGVINFRIRPGETADDVLEHVRKTVNDPRVKVRTLLFGSNPSPVSDADSPQYHLLARTIRSLYPETIVTPYLVVGATDSRHFTTISRQIFRFLPIELTQEDFHRFHGLNERIGVENYRKVVRFYAQLLMEAASNK